MYFVSWLQGWKIIGLNPTSTKSTGLYNVTIYCSFNVLLIEKTSKTRCCSFKYVKYTVKHNLLLFMFLYWYAYSIQYAVWDLWFKLLCLLVYLVYMLVWKDLEVVHDRFLLTTSRFFAVKMKTPNIWAIVILRSDE